MKKFVLSLLFVTTPVFAEFHTISAIQASNGIPAWQNAFKERITDHPASPTGNTECGETQELKGAFLCLSENLEDMNRALIRATVFAEGLDGVQAGEVIQQSSGTFQYYLRLIGGHDLKSDVLLAFYRKAQVMCERDPATCLNTQEREYFEKFIIPLSGKVPNFVLITFALKDSMPYTDIVTHEILHAQFFLQSGFSDVVKQFWNGMPEPERRYVRQLLARNYDPANELLMQNEFQAYVLMANAEKSELGLIVPKYRGPLMEALSLTGIKPIQVE